MYKYRSILIERLDSPSLRVSRFQLPDLHQLFLNDDLELSTSDQESLSRSLPEATGLLAHSLSPNLGAFRKNGLHQAHESALLLNPLGAGDTCSGVFLLEYLDTRVSFYTLCKLIDSLANPDSLYRTQSTPSGTDLRPRQPLAFL